MIDIEGSEERHVMEAEVVKLLSDRKRSGRKPRVTAEQQAVIFKTACEDPKKRPPISRWSGGEFRLHLMAERLIDSISGRWINELLRRAKIRLHRNKHWLTSKDKADPR
ncbi:MAG: helix-turn-helix domain-containing protein [Planctomycetota bacterium]